MMYIKQMRLVKKKKFSVPELTHGAWQQMELGTGLGGQLPFTAPAKAPSDHTLHTLKTSLVAFIF